VNSTELEGARDRTFRRLVVIATVAWAAIMIAWLLITPAFRAPDEHVHFNSVIRLEYGGGWPAPGDAFVGPGVATAMSEAGLSYKLPRSEVHWGNPPVYLNKQTPPETYSTIEADNALQEPGATVADQMSQHPPLFYAIQAGAARIAGMPGQPWPTQLLFARLLDVLMMLPLPWLVASTARLLVSSPGVAGATAFFPLALPQVPHIASSVSNDNLANLLAAVVAWLAVRLYVRGGGWRPALVLGLAMGLAAFTKGTTLVLLPLMAFALYAAPGVSGVMHRLYRSAAGLGVAFATGGFWWLINLVRYGDLQPSGLTINAGLNPDPSRTPLNFFSHAAEAISESFVGRFSYLELTFSGGRAIYVVATIIVAAVAGVAVARGRRVLTLAMIAAPVMTLVFMFRSSYPWYVDFGLLPGLQGRYLFVCLVPLAALIAIFWDALMRVRWAWITIPVLVVGAGFTAAAGLRVAMRGFYQGRDERFADVVIDRAAAWVPGGHVAVISALVLIALAVAASWYAAWHVRNRRVCLDA
jgi:4-amino-4-deoxy-L-arabinose transferase-like glycosyltransferase